MKGLFGKFAQTLILIFLNSSAWAVVQDENVLLSIYGDEEFVSLATGRRQLISKAPAVATVITAEDIRAAGAVTLSDVLGNAPGIHASKSSVGYNPVYIIRGVYSGFNPQVLVLINGVPITNVYFGDRGQLWGGMPVENISRIEVIRGPGSAVYGADAFSGVINIITKKANDINGTKTGVRVGSFDFAEAWLLHETTLGYFDAALSFEVRRSDGHGGVIEKDLQSNFDAIFMTSVSEAPGETSTGLESIDFRIDLESIDWQLHLGYQGRDKVGSGAGVASALDSSRNNTSERLNFDVEYNGFSLSSDWDMKAQFSYFDASTKTDLILFPKGAVIPIGSDGNIATPGGGIVFFPEGVLGNPHVFEQHYRLGLDAFYFGFSDHSLRFGFGSNYENLDVKEEKNFGPSVIDGTEGVVGGVLTNVSNTQYAFNKGGDRTVYYFFAQDSWKFSNDWELTTGLRYDDYSDFGSTTNPRLALVWSTSHNLTTKILYGQAFRAPSFSESRNQNNPVALGNPDLNPEKMSTFEVAFDYRANNDLKFALNLFSYKWEDIILFVPDGSTGNVANNVGKQSGDGLEFEAAWKLNADMRLVGNYAYQKSIDDSVNENAGNAPTHQLYARLEWKFLPFWNFNSQVNSVMDRKRPFADTRNEIDDYTIVDAVLRYAADNQNWETALSVRNLFDEDAREPGPITIPDDLPLAGRSMQLEFRYQF